MPARRCSILGDVAIRTHCRSCWALTWWCASCESSTARWTSSNTDDHGMRAELDARFTLQTAEVGRLFGVLAAALRINAAD